MNIHIRIKVKFRAFKITYKEIDHQWRLELGPLGLDFEEEKVNVPKTARVLFDRFGVKVNAW